MEELIEFSNSIFENYGIKFHFIEMDDSSQIKPHINENTKMLWQKLLQIQC